MKALRIWVLNLSLLFLLSGLHAQEVCLEVMALGKKVGNLYAYKSVMGSEVKYFTRSIINMDARIKQLRIEAENSAIYHGNKLISVKSHTKVNGEPHSSSYIRWDKGKYRITIDGKTKEPLEEMIHFSGSMLYFQEPPSGLTRSFSESSAAFVKIKDLGQGVYELFDPHNNRKMMHRYQNGNLAQIKIKHSFMTIYMEP